MTANIAPVVRVRRYFDAAPERVYDAWLDPAIARNFLFKVPEGDIVRSEIDARVGGTLLIVDRRPDGDASHYGVFLELQRPRRIVFAFSIERHDPEADRVEIDIVPQGDGCELTLTHTMDPEHADYASRTETGWTMIVDGLATLLRGRDGGPA